jgi:SAM-dependent methyltransferase
MSDERPLAPVPKPVDSDAAPTLPDLASAASSKPETIRSPAAAETSNGPLTSLDSGDPSTAFDQAPGEAAFGTRKRGRLALRIPDDEVARPQTAAPAAARSTGGPADSTPPPSSSDDAIVPARIITINPPPPSPAAAEPAPRLELAMDPDGEEIHFDDVPTPPVKTAEDDPAPRPEARSDPSEGELCADDLVALEATPSPPLTASLPPMRPRIASRPSATQAPPVKAAAPPVAPTTPIATRPSKPPLVIVPPHMGSVAPQPLEGSGLRRKGRLWWEELFNDDYLRAAERITDQQLAREVDFIEVSLGIERGGTLLDLACGTGRHAVELARRGYRVVGFDLSLAMLARASDEAQERRTKLNFVQGDMREMTFAEQFDGVYCWNTSFGYFEEEKNAAVVDRVRSGLKAGGLLLLDVVNRDFVIQQSPSLAWFEGDGCVCMDEMVVDFITSRMRIKRTMMLDDGRSREIEYSMRIYSLHELGKMLHEHGFKVCEVSGCTATPGVFFGHVSPRTIILAEKR